MVVSEEAHKTKKGTPIHCSVLTISDTRTKETDKSGRLMVEEMEGEGQRIVEYHIIPDEKQMILEYLQRGIENMNIDVILLNGGTGIAKRDVTIEAVKELIEKELPGFGEIFRMLSYSEDIGSAAMLSRAIAGVAGRTAIFSTPGSSGAVHLAMKRLIIPEIHHVINELKKCN